MLVDHLPKCAGDFPIAAPIMFALTPALRPAAALPRARTFTAGM